MTLKVTNNQYGRLS